MSAAALDIRPLAGACGGEVFGVDATKPLSNDVSAALKAAWLENQVIVLRDQDLSPAGLIQWRWGLGTDAMSRTADLALLQTPSRKVGMGFHWY